VERKSGKTVPTGQMTGLHCMKSGLPALKLSEVISIRREFRKISSRIASGDLPQVAEFNTPLSMDAAGECSAYDGFKAWKIV
jgi:hypothetical protein